MIEKNNLKATRDFLLHVMACAVKNLYPGVKFATGSVTENGFYYDFDFGERKLGKEDLKKIEKEMKNILKKNYNFEKRETDISEAITKEKNAGQIYRQEFLEGLRKEANTKISYCRIGEFEDLYQGKCLEKINKNLIGIFKLYRIAGAYWKGAEKNKMLTRIYVIAFESKEKISECLEKIMEAERRDHRKLGRELDLFHIDKKVGLGLPLWHPKGAILWKLIEDYWHKRHLESGYDLVRSPHIGNRELWETSGHWSFFNSNMYPPLEIGRNLEECHNKRKTKRLEEYLLKPMNCPFHIQIYKNSPRSYRDLPLRWAECGTVYRFEKKGELSGLTRVRGFTQDDAHIICRKDQVEEELRGVVDFIISVFHDFGFDIGLINVYLSLRGPDNKEKYVGNDEGWEFAQDILRKVALDKKLNFVEEEGEAAFYGPKLDFKLKDVLGREWQCSTLQFDFNLPERFDMTFTNQEGKNARPYVLHRALFGSFERFLALLIEHYAGSFPIWLSPVQVKLISVSEAHIDYCQQLSKAFRANNIRTEIDDSDETVSNKIRKVASEKVPYILVIGDKELKSGKLSVRDRGSQGTRDLKKKDFIEEIKELSLK